MAFFFASVFLLGIGLGVVAMLKGVERRAPSAPPQAVSARFGLPTLAAFFTGFGALGYILVRTTDLAVIGAIGLAAVGGVSMIVAVVVLIARWAVPAARREIPDERFEHQGAFARVLSPIDGTRPGTISFDASGRTIQSSARSLDGSPIAAGTEVVIERIEAGIAWVERWEQVERRL